MDISPTQQVAQTLFMSPHVSQHHSPIPLPLSTEFQNPLSHPLSCHSHQTTPILQAMTLPDAIRFYQRTATDLSVAIPEELSKLSIASYTIILLMSYLLSWFGGKPKPGTTIL